MRLLLLAGALLCSPALAQPADAARVDAIFEKIANQRTPGCAVGVARGGTTLLTRGYGSADLEHGVPITADTLFEGGSVSKQFTAAAILLLAADGKLKLSDDVRKYVPELPDYGSTITLDHLLNHTSGLRDWGMVMDIAGWPRGSRTYTMDDVLAIITRQRSLNHAPGAEYSYTNSGYNLLAVIVSRVSGSNLPEFTKSRLFEPLGMGSTSWRDDFRRIVPGRAMAYEGSGQVFRQFMPFEDAYGNAGLLTNVQDLLTWNEALFDGKLGARTTQRLADQAVLTDGRRISYARGLFVQSFQEQAEIAHSGAIGGYRAWLGRYPEVRLSVALLCNSGGPPGTGTNPTLLARRVASAFLPSVSAPTVTIVPEARHQTVDPALAGTFVNERDGLPLQLALDDGRLRLANGAPLERIGPGRYRMGPAEVSFAGAHRLQVTTPDGDQLSYRRAREFSPSAHDLQSYAGRYESNEARAAYVVSAQGKELKLRLEDRPHIDVPLRPIYQDAFELPKGWAKVPEGVIRFHRSKAGTIRSLGFGVERVRNLEFVRVAGYPTLRPDLVSSGSR